MTDELSRSDRQDLIRIAKGRAKQAEREAETREKILVTEVLELMTAEYEARDRLWAEAVTIAEEYVAKANAEIRARCADLGIPPQHAPGIQVGWRARSGEFENRQRREELRKLAEQRASTMTKMAKTQIQERVRGIEEKLILGGLESEEARELVASMPTPEQLMPPLSLDSIGVERWQPDEDAASKLTAPRTTADWRRRKILRAIAANPGASARAIAKEAGVDHKTVLAHLRSGESGEEIPTDTGELPIDGGEIPTDTGELPNEDVDDEAHPPPGPLAGTRPVRQPNRGR